MISGAKPPSRPGRVVDLLEPRDERVDERTIEQRARAVCSNDPDAHVTWLTRQVVRRKRRYEARAVKPHLTRDEHTRAAVNERRDVNGRRDRSIPLLTRDTYARVVIKRTLQYGDA